MLSLGIVSMFMTSYFLMSDLMITPSKLTAERGLNLGFASDAVTFLTLNCLISAEPGHGGSADAGNQYKAFVRGIKGGLFHDSPLFKFIYPRSHHLRCRHIQKFQLRSSFSSVYILRYYVYTSSVSSRMEACALNFLNILKQN